MKKMVLFTLAAVIAFGLFAGCQSENQNIPNKTQNAAQNTVNIDKQ